MNHDPAPRRPPMPPPEPATRPQTASYSSPRKKAKRATALFAALWVVTLISLIATIHQNTLIQNLIDGHQVSDQQLLTSDMLLLSISYIYLAVFVAAALAFLIWLHRASTNLATIGTEKPDFGPVGAIVWWFIPIFNLLVPYLIVKDIWLKSHPQPSRLQVLALISPWWLTWIIGLMATNIATNTLSRNNQTLSEIHTSNSLSYIGDVISLISLTLAIIIVWKTTSNQELKHSQLPPRH